jgi:hypothetical protein
MVRTQTETSRQKLAADNMTAVAKIHRALQSGQLKSELRTVQEAIHAARALNAQAKAAMDDKGLTHAKDFSMHIAFMTPDLSTLFTRRFELGQEAVIQAELSGPGMCCVMVGLVFGIRDHDHGGDWLIGARPFLATPLVLMALKQRIDEGVVGIN